MAGKLEGKVAFITGAARGQGRAHAIAMAREGADIIAVDICRDIRRTHIPWRRPRSRGTERSVKEIGRRVVAKIADVRERHELATLSRRALRSSADRHRRRQRRHPADGDGQARPDVVRRRY